ncbi:MAG: twin-arginine translocation signal domain-containing protein [Chitinivibrionales bacterium]|nr:twin-arginine translocation signal domain-containing protein [Chitinivibrionales bacterium]
MSTYSSRRDFLKVSAAGAAAATLGAGVRRAEAATGAWTDGMRINPAIDNLRVVCCHDPAMVNKQHDEFSWLNDRDSSAIDRMTNQNDAANTATIQSNLDEMAKALANNAEAAAAWATIFQEPAAGYANARVAIKVNCIAVNHPRLAVVDKVCRVLNDLGVPFTNMTIYDGCHNASPEYGSFVGTRLPAGVVVSSRSGSLGGTTDAPVPRPRTSDLSNVENHSCTADIANGVIDILVNIAVNKGHSNWNGNCTLTMKHHYGTFAPADHGSTSDYVNRGMSYIIGINQSDAILGGTPCRQQLCIIDSLWAGTGGPGGGANTSPHRLIMGTFGPAVDYLTVMKIREEIMGVGHNAYVDDFLPAFGYSTTERDNLLTLSPEENDGKGWLEFTGSAPVQRAFSGRTVGREPFTVTLAGQRYAASTVTFRLPAHTGPTAVRISGLNGRTVRSFSTATRHVRWDGLDERGVPVSAGSYVVRVSGNGFSDARRLAVR